MNSIFYSITNITLLKIVILISVLSLISCAQEQVKPESSISTNNATKNQKISTSKNTRKKFRAGITALNNNKLSKAQKIFNEFIIANPKLAGGYSNLALVHFKNKEYKKSLSLINTAIKLNPKQAQALNLRAQLYVISGKIHKAKNDYLLAITLKPMYTNAQYNLALLYDIYLQEIELAIQHYKIYISLLKKPDDGTQEWVKHLKGTLDNG